MIKISPVSAEYNPSRESFSSHAAEHPSRESHKLVKSLRPTAILASMAPIRTKETCMNAARIGYQHERETRLLHHLQMTFLLAQLPTQVPLSTSCLASLGRPPHGRSDCTLLNFLLEYTYAFISGHLLRPKNPRCHRYLHERKLRLSRQLLATPTDETRMNVNHVLQSWRCWMPQKPRMHLFYYPIANFTKISH